MQKANDKMGFVGGKMWMVTCSTPVLSLALVSTKIMLYLPGWIPNGGWEQTNKKFADEQWWLSKTKFVKQVNRVVIKKRLGTFLPNLLPPAPPPFFARHDHICCQPVTCRFILSFILYFCPIQFSCYSVQTDRVNHDSGKGAKIFFSLKPLR